jgi:hypothetical protein
MKLKEFKLLTERWSRHIHEDKKVYSRKEKMTRFQAWAADAGTNIEGFSMEDPAGIIDDDIGGRALVDSLSEREKAEWAENAKARTGWNAITFAKMLDPDPNPVAPPAEITAQDDTDTNTIPDAGPTDAGAAPTENLARQIVQTLQAHLVTYAGAPEVQPGKAGAPKGGGENFIDGKFGPLTRKYLRRAMAIPANPEGEGLVYIPGADEESGEDDE